MINRKICAAVALIAACPFASVGVAHASQPAVQACVGSTFSQDVQAVTASGGIPGQQVRAFVQAPDGQPGLGDGIQQLQAGQVSQNVIPNTCNV